MASLRTFLKTFKKMFGGAKGNTNRRNPKMEAVREGVYTDVVNQNTVSVEVKAKEVKGLKKFLADVWLVITMHMRGLYWVQRTGSMFVEKPLNPTEYGAMPNVRRIEKRQVTNQQIIGQHNRKMRKVGGKYYMPAGAALAAQRALVAKRSEMRREKMAAGAEAAAREASAREAGAREAREVRQSYAERVNALSPERQVPKSEYMPQDSSRATFLELSQARDRSESVREYS